MALITNTATLLLDTTALTGSDATVYTAPTVTGGGLAAVIRNIHVCNTSGTDRQLYMAKTTYGASTAIFTGLTIPANDALSLDVYIGLLTVQIVRAYATVGGGLTIMLMGVV